ncbi:hypothetical protein [Cesiribacter sp. SM1]|uniref:hypothetical protein n=1 Tax=Cesiribacter sp. SM1 TaxID=2861196 RepID=UPI001CD1BEF3|nr:hypothetical protein [Cesiribacter sp. SM1]
MIEFAKIISQLLEDYYVEYLIVGGTALMLYKQKIGTRDLDILILNNEGNISKFKNIINNEQLILDFKENMIIRVQGKPYCIDFHSRLDGLNEIDLFKNYTRMSIGNYNLRVINLTDLYKNLSAVKSNINEIIRTQV